MSVSVETRPVKQVADESGVRSATQTLVAVPMYHRPVYHRPMYHRAMHHQPMDGCADTTAFILAGGKSTRMGADKAFVEWHGHTLLSLALEKARSIASDVRIVGSKETFSSFAPVVEDVFRDRGPLAGIHAALLASSAELNVMIAVDMPFLTEEFLRYMIERARKSARAVVIVPRTEGRFQPLCAVYRREFARNAEASLLAERNKIGSLFQVVRIDTMEEQELVSAGFSSDIFRNINTPDQLERGAASISLESQSK